MVCHVVVVLLGGLSLAESFHVNPAAVRPTRSTSVAKPQLRANAEGSASAAVSSAAAANPGKEETLNWSKQVRCVCKIMSQSRICRPFRVVIWYGL